MAKFPGWDEGVAALRNADPMMGELISRFPKGHLEPKGDLFHTLIRAIVGQQISVKAAQTVWDRFVLVCGDVTPSAILQCSADDLRGAGLSRMKASYILGIAGAPESCDMEALIQMDDASVLRTLTA